MKKLKDSLPSCYQLMEGHDTGWNTYTTIGGHPTDPRWNTMNIDRDLGTEFMDSAEEVRARAERAL